MSTPTIDDAAGVRVLVTGASGYVAGWLIERLLKAGAVVHATVRDPSNTAKIAHLQDMAAGAAGSIAFFKTDLLEAGSHDRAMHKINPFSLNDEILKLQASGTRA